MTVDHVEADVGDDHGADPPTPTSSGALVVTDREVQAQRERRRCVQAIRNADQHDKNG